MNKTKPNKKTTGISMQTLEIRQWRWEAGSKTINESQCAIIPVKGFHVSV